MKSYNLRKNSAKVYKDGTFWETNNCGLLEVIGQTDRKNGKLYCYFLCRFEDGTIVEAQSAHIKNGKVNNPNKKSVYGVGFMGIGEHISYNKLTKSHSKQYSVWQSMIERCYCKRAQEKHPTYIECSVDERWHNFQNFCNDIRQIEGYSEWISDDCKMQLDKDIKVKGNKIYGKDFCKFVTAKENSTHASITGNTYIGTRICDDYTEEFENQTEFAKKYSLTRSKICLCVNGKNKTHKGWKFKIKQEHN